VFCPFAGVGLSAVTTTERGREEAA